MVWFGLSVGGVVLEPLSLGVDCTMSHSPSLARTYRLSSGWKAGSDTSTMELMSRPGDVDGVVYSQTNGWRRGGSRWEAGREGGTQGGMEGSVRDTVARSRRWMRGSGKGGGRQAYCGISGEGGYEMGRTGTG